MTLGAPSRTSVRPMHGIGGESRAPQPITDHDHAIAEAHFVFVGVEEAAELRLNGERAERRRAEPRSR